MTKKIDVHEEIYVALKAYGPAFGYDHIYPWKNWPTYVIKSLHIHKINHPYREKIEIIIREFEANRYNILFSL